MNSLFKLAGSASIIQGLLYITATFTIALVPTAEIFKSVSPHLLQPTSFVTASVCFVALGLLGLIFVAPATVILLEKKEKFAWLKAGQYLAQSCLMITVLYFARFLYFTAEGVSGTTNPLTSWVAWPMFGGMGIFVLLVAAATLRTKLLPTMFVGVCFLKTFGFWLILAGMVSHNFPVLVAGAIIGGLLGGPIYHFWLGRVLWKA